MRMLWIVREDGDVFGRYKVRLDEIRESLRILEQLIDAIPVSYTHLDLYKRQL